LTKMPAVLVEYGFMDSSVDAPVILTDAYSKKVAYATMEGIAKVAGLKKKVGDQPAAEKKTLAEIAKEVTAGKWGNGADRKNRLTAAGYDYDQVQAQVNALVTGKKSAAPAKTLEQIAKEVIAGKWGNGAQRKNKLTAAGYDYAAVQRRVNQLMKG